MSSGIDELPERGITIEEHGRALIGLISKLGETAGAAGTAFDTCVVTPPEFTAMLYALTPYERHGRRHGLIIAHAYGVTEAIARGDCPPGRMAVGGPELCK